MADLNIRPKVEPEEDYTTAEIIYWTVGILMIPLAPILMIWFLTPWAGM